MVSLHRTVSHGAQNGHVTTTELLLCCVVVEIEVALQKTYVLSTSANMGTPRSDSGLLHGECIKIQVANSSAFS